MKLYRKRFFFAAISLIAVFAAAFVLGAPRFTEGAIFNEEGVVPTGEADAGAPPRMTSVDILEQVGGYIGASLDMPINTPEGLVGAIAGEEVVLVEDPESKALEEKLKKLEQLPPTRKIDAAAVALAKAYDEAGGAPMPYLQDNGRINFYFGTLNPRIVCKPLRLTDIELEPGEKVRNVHISDSARWMVSSAQSGTDGELAAHVIVKPLAPDIAANMLIHTDRRTYSLEFVSGVEGQFMPYVGFVYPDVPSAMKAADAESWNRLLAAYKRADDVKAAEEASRKPEITARTVDPENIYTKYTIKVVKGKNIPWKPTSAYDSGGHTYIVMPAKMSVTESPAFFIKTNGKEKLTNYRVEGDRYIVDRLFDIGILQVGGDRVAIYRDVKVAAPDKN
ncbi:MAG: TrbG/VirB9 family P-type conjugative transfer protein [Synergistaceae bacterium]|jgi:type IV secretion system protein VirB9|nr:TrbG/VirB9 family P-type conjugative transfer protein [Synergistaceae bacterium]